MSSDYARVLGGRPVTSPRPHRPHPPSKPPIDNYIHIRDSSPGSMKAVFPDDLHNKTRLASIPDDRASTPKSSRKRPAGSDVQMKDPPHDRLTHSSKNIRTTPPRGSQRASAHATDPVSPKRRSNDHQKPGIGYSNLGHPVKIPQRQKPSPPNAQRSSGGAPQQSGHHHSIGPHRTVQQVIDSHPVNQRRKKGLPVEKLPQEDDSSEYEDGELPPSNTNYIIKQPDSNPISQQQLAAEVRGIYSGLVMVESKCIALTGQGNSTRPADPRPEAATQFQGLIALHRTLLHEHHDFLLASQHPSASQAIKDLASRYSMPARMWKHGIHNFLELLRHQLPVSLDYMLAFIYLAYQMMALLYDTVPVFEETWIECLGDLARYRMAIEDEDLRDREIWTGVAKMWYLRAVDRNPNIGRLYHHLAILARNSPVQQLASYCRALTANQPFLSTRDSVLTLFQPSLSRWRDPHSRTISIDTWFVVTHAVMFLREPVEQLYTAMKKFLSQLDEQIGRSTVRWKDTGASIAVANIGGVLKYGCTNSRLRSILAPEENLSSQPAVLEPERDEESPDPDVIPCQSGRVPHEWNLLVRTLSISLQRTSDPNVLPHVHIMLAFFWRLSATPQGAAFTARYAPWPHIAAFANALASAPAPPSFPVPNEASDRVPLADDYLLNGQVWANGYFPPSTPWLELAPADLDERFMERQSAPDLRARRVRWVARQLAEAAPRAGPVAGRCQWLAYDAEQARFACRVLEVEELPAGEEGASDAAGADDDDDDDDEMAGVESG